MSNDYRKRILLKLLEHGYVGARHTNEDNIYKGFTQRDRKDIEDAYESLRKEGLFIIRPKADGLHISLNPRMFHRVREIIEDPSDA